MAVFNKLAGFVEHLAEKVHNLGADALKDVTKGGTGALKDATKGIGDLFKKK